MPFSQAYALPSYAPTDVSGLTDANVRSLIDTVAIGFDHHAYSPAMPMGIMLGVDVGVDFSVLTLPSEFTNAMKASGASSSLPSVLALPRLNVHKGLPAAIDIGFSYFGYQSNSLIGADVKWAFIRGSMISPSVALRVSGNLNRLFFMTTRTYDVDLVISKRVVLIFNPYVGGGLQFINGNINVPPGLTVSSQESTTTTHVYVGLPIRLGFIKLSPEYDYSAKGISTYGGKFSLSF